MKFSRLFLLLTAVALVHLVNAQTIFTDYSNSQKMFNQQEIAADRFIRSADVVTPASIQPADAAVAHWDNGISLGANLKPNNFVQPYGVNFATCNTSINKTGYASGYTTAGSVDAAYKALGWFELDDNTGSLAWPGNAAYLNASGDALTLNFNEQISQGSTMTMSLGYINATTARALIEYSLDGTTWTSLGYYSRGTTTDAFYSTRANRFAHRFNFTVPSGGLKFIRFTWVAGEVYVEAVKYNAVDRCAATCNNNITPAVSVVSSASVTNPNNVLAFNYDPPIDNATTENTDAAGFEGGSTGQMVVDLGSTISNDQYLIISLGAALAGTSPAGRQMAVSVSLDNSTWNQLGIIGNNLSTNATHYFSGTKYRYHRFALPAAGARYVKVVEQGTNAAGVDSYIDGIGYGGCGSGDALDFSADIKTDITLTPASIPSCDAVVMTWAKANMTAGSSVGSFTLPTGDNVTLDASEYYQDGQPVAYSWLSGFPFTAAGSKIGELSLQTATKFAALPGSFAALRPNSLAAAGKLVQQTVKLDFKNTTQKVSPYGTSVIVGHLYPSNGSITSSNYVHVTAILEDGSTETNYTDWTYTRGDPAKFGTGGRLSDVCAGCLSYAELPHQVGAVASGAPAGFIVESSRVDLLTANDDMVPVAIHLPENRRYKSISVRRIAKFVGTDNEYWMFGLGVPLDYGDAPDSYKTLSASSGASHMGRCGGNLKLGQLFDADLGTQPSATFPTSAGGDDSTIIADEDGLVDTAGAFNKPVLVFGADGAYNLRVAAFNNKGKIANLYAWVDVNGDGKFSGDEAATASVPSSTQNQFVNLSWANAKAFMDCTTPSCTKRYIRLRLTTDTLLNTNAGTATLIDTRSYGMAGDGEVEDFMLNNRPPEALPNKDTTSINTPATGNVITDLNSSGAKDSDPDGDAVVLTSFSVGGVSYPAGQTATIPNVGTIVLNANGSYTFTPETGYTGNVPTVGYTINDGKGGIASSILDILVENTTTPPTNQPPVSVNDAATTPQGTPVVVDIKANDTDPDNTTSELTPTIIGNPNNGTSTVDPTTGRVTYTPNPTFSGKDTITYKTCDPSGKCDTSIVVVTVTPDPNPMVPFGCTGDAFLMLGKGTNPHSYLYKLDLETGDTILIKSLIAGADSGINAIGYNIKDGFIWGALAFTGKIAKVGANGNATYYSIPGLPKDTYPVGDVSSNGHLFIVNANGGLGNATKIYEIDIDPASSTYLTIVSSNTSTTIPNVRDWSFNPRDNKIYTIDNLLNLYRINPATGLGVQIGQVSGGKPAITSQQFGGNYFDNLGNFYISGNNGPIYKIMGVTAMTQSTTATRTPVFLSKSISVSYNDGARCPLTPLTNEPPVAVNDSATTPEDTPVDINFIANDTDPDSTASFLTPSVIDSASHGKLIMDPATGKVTYTPDSNFTGKDTITYKICDSLGKCDTAIIVITVTPVNDPPVVDNETHTTPKNTPVSGDLTNAGDSDMDGNLVVTTTPEVAPKNGNIVINPDGTYTYTPNTDYVGNDTVVVKICDDGTPLPANCKFDTVFIIVTPTSTPNLPPVAVNDSATTAQNTPVTVDIKANDSDPDNTNAELTPTVLDSTNHGKLVVDPTTGKVIYTPDPNFSGNDTLTYQLCDPLGKCDTAIVVITVTPNNPPPVVPPAPEPDVNQTFVGTPVKGDVGTNDDVPPGTTYGTPTPVPGNPSNVLPTINPDGTYTFNPDKPGIYQFNVPVCAPGQTTNCPTTLLTITVLDPNALNNPPVANTDVASTMQSTPVTLKTLANDKPGDVDAALVPSTVAITTQPKNGTATVNATTGDITYTPNADFTGNDTLYYKVCDNNTPSLCTNAMQVITVEATGSENSTQAADDYNTTVGTTPATGNVLTNDTDPEKNTQTVTPIDSTLPEGKMVINADGSYTFTPKPGFSGPVNIPYKVCDNGTPQACTEATLYIMVSAPPTVNQPPVALNDSATTNEDTPVLIDIKANDSDPDNTNPQLTITVLDSTNHGKLVLDPTTGNVTYTPDSNYTGNDTLTYKICDSLGKCDTAIVVITITPVNDPPIIDNETHTTPMNTPVSGDLTNVGDSDVDGNLVVNTTLVDAPNNGTIVINPDGSYTYTPNNNYVGKDTVVVKICDDGTPLPAICKNDTIFITVTPVAVLATPEPDVNQTFVGVPVTGDVSTNDDVPVETTYGTPTPVPGNPGTALPEIKPDGTYTFNPDKPGVYQFLVPVCAPGQTTNCPTTLLTITVLDPASNNNPPVANTDEASTLPATPVTLKTLANDKPGDVDASLVPATVTITSAPKHGTASVNPITGDITYTPAVGFAGNDTLYYKVCDNNTPSLCTNAMQVITVEPVGAPNTTQAADDYNTTVGTTPATGNVLTNDTDPEKNKQIVTPIDSTLPQGKVVINADGTYTFTPAPNFVGPVNIPYKVCDNGTPQACTEATLYILVRANLPPVALNDSALTTLNTPVKIDVKANDSDPDNSNPQLSVTLLDSTNHGTLVVDPVTGEVTYTPNNNFSGNDTLTYKICDPSGKCDTAKVFIVVDAVNDPPVAVNDSTTTLQGTPVIIDFKANDSDPDNANSQLTPTVLDSTNHGKIAIDPVTGKLTYTPDPAFSGKDTLTYKICDPGGLCDTAIVVITVTPVLPEPDVNQTYVGVQVTGDVSTNDDVPPGATYGIPTSVAGNPGTAVPVIKPDGTYTFNPDKPGEYVFVVPVCPIGQTTNCPTSLLNITVLDPVKPNPPVANTDIATTPFNTPVTLKTLANDQPGNSGVKLDSTSVLVTQQPKHGTTSVNPTTGDITYTPANGFVGNDTLYYKVCDKNSPSLCDTAMQIITVEAPPPVPNTTQATDDYNTTKGTTPAVGNVLLNDTDPEKNAQVVTPIDSTLPSGKILINADGSYVFTPKPGFSGPVNMPYTVCDNGTPQACTQATLYITVEPAAMPLPEPDVNQTFVGLPVKGDVSTNDDVPAGTTYGTPTPMPGNPGSAVPTVNPDGTYTFNPDKPGVYQFLELVCAPGQTTNCPPTLLTITVLDPNALNNPPVANTDEAITMQNTPVTLKTLVNDKPGDLDAALVPSTVAITTQPKNGIATVNPTTGDITYTPKEGFTGNDTLYYKVCDNNVPSLCTNAMQVITVEPNGSPNTTQAADDYNTTTSTQPATGNVLVNDTDPEKNTQTVTPIDSTLPQGKIVINADGSYVFTPKPGFSGPVNVPYKVCDNGTPQACTEATLYILVTESTPEPDVNQTFVGIPVKGDVSTNDDVPVGTTYGTPTPVPGNPGTAVPTVNPDGTYTFNPDKPGVYQFLEPVCAPGQTTNCPPTLLTITVLDTAKLVNNPPVANTDEASTMQNTPVTLKTLVNDKPGDVDAALVPSTVAITTQPKNGTATVNPTTGDITYTPKAGFTGNDTLYYKVCDNNIPSLCANAMQVITVEATGSENSTQAADDYNTTTNDKPATGNVLTNDTDPEKNTQTVTPQTKTLHEGTFDLKADGTYTFTPKPGFVGPVNIPYTLCDNGTPQACTDATLYILVTAPPPVAVIVPEPDVNQTFVNVPVKGDVSTNDDVPVGTTYGTPTPVPGNPNNSVPNIKPDGTYTFNTTVPGIYQYNVPVCAPGQTTNCPTTLLTITVLDPTATNNPPIANTDEASTMQDQPVTLKTLVNDRPGDLDAALVPSTVAITSQPKNGTATVNPTTGDITYTPKAGFVGNDTLYYKVCDNNTPSLCTNAMQVITVKANGSPNSTQGADDFNRTSGDIPATGNVLTNDSDPETNGQTVTPQSTTLPEGTFVLNADGSYVFTPNPGFSGPVNIPYSVCDNGTPQACTEATLFILVTQATFSDPGLNIPGGFSPNGDNIDDAFIITAPAGSKVALMIFNRWQHKIYHSDDYHNDWKGQGPGNVLGDYVPMGTYYYIVTITDASGNAKKYAGPLTLVQ